MSKELDPYPGNLKQHVVKVTKQDIDVDGMLKALRSGDIVLVRDNVEELKSLLREGEQYMEHREECDVFDEDKATVDGEVGTGPWDTAFIPAPCSCGLDAYLEKLKSRTK